MQELEKILEEMRQIKDGNRKENLYAKYPPNGKDQEVLNAYSQGYEDGTDNFYNAVVYIIRKHMNDGWIPVEDLSGCGIELKPCPFCGCGAEVFVRGDDRYTARCRSCFCGTGEYKDPRRASEAWNRRADNEQNNRQ